MRLWLVIIALSGGSSGGASSNLSSATPPPAWLSLCDHARALCAAAVPGHLSPALAELCHDVDANCTTQGPWKLTATPKPYGRTNARIDVAGAAASRAASRGTHTTKATARATVHTVATTSQSLNAAAQVLAFPSAQSQLAAGHRGLKKHTKHSAFHQPSHDPGSPS